MIPCCAKERGCRRTNAQAPPARGMNFALMRTPGGTSDASHDERGVELAKRVINGDWRALARAVTIIENDDPAAAALAKALYPRTGRAHVVGITGPPGAGKSTLVDGLASVIRKQGLTVGIIAVDPSSPYTGGAVLGDRVRMQRHAGDPGVFIRS